MVHRDLKPNNVMMVPGVGPVVMDFGLAKQQRGDNQTLTRTGTTMGTPAYMPPEQVKGELDRLGPASDVYSLGVILFELLTGELPFTGGSAAEVYGRILFAAAPAPSALRPGLPAALDAICVKATAKAPEDRYASMKAFAAALIEYLKATSATTAAENGEPPKAVLDIFDMPTEAPRRPKTDTPTVRTNLKQARPEERGKEGAALAGATHKASTHARRGAHKPKKMWLWAWIVSGVAVLVLLCSGGLGVWAGSVYLLGRMSARNVTMDAYKQLKKGMSEDDVRGCNSMASGGRQPPDSSGKSGG